jgi:large subunit ribosomal protein L25
MSAMHTYEAEARTAIGTSAAIKQRAAGRVPVTISKRGAPSRHVTIAKDQAAHLIKHVAHLCKVKLGTDEITALRGEIATHCLEDYVQHIDLQEVDATSEIVVDVLVSLKSDECPGIKSGGIVEQRLRSVKIRCPASSIPDAIELDMSNVQVQETVYAKSLALPKGTSLVTRADLPVVSVVIPRWMKKADEAAEGTAGAAAPAAGAAAPAADGKAAPAAAAAGAKPDAKAAAAKAPAKK